MIMSSLWSYVKHFAFKYWVWYFFGTIALIATTLINLTIPQLSKKIVNALNQNPELFGQGAPVATSQSGTAESTGLDFLDFLVGHSLTDIALVIIVLGALLIVVRTLSRILIFWPGQSVTADTRSWMVRQFLRMKQGFLIESGIGDLISRLSNDCVHLRLVCGFGLLQLMNMTFMLAMALTLMLQTNVALTLLSLAPITVMLFVTYLGMPFMTRYSKEQQEIMGVLTNRVTESFVNVQTVQTHVAYESFEARVEKENQRQFKVSVKLLIVRTLTFPLMLLFSGFSEVIVVFFGGYKVVEGTLTVGDILTFSVYVGMLTWPLASIGILVSIIQRASTALTRLKGVELSAKEEFDVDTPSSKPALQGKSSSGLNPILEVRNLTYAYESRPDVEVLKSMSFEMGPNERIGVCGPVGSGKSTLFSLITRIFDVPEGKVFVDGTDVSQCSLKELRSSVRHVGQVLHLFSDSVRANLSFGLEPPPSEEELIQACKRAQVWSDICELPEGLETEIGERGVRLSGGQKQRISLARMLLRPGHLFLFDDVLSAVDTHTESALLETFFDLKTPFIITSHRESTLKKCDRVMLLEEGAIKYLGPFDGLQAHIALEKI